jgi:hemolysin III
MYDRLGVMIMKNQVKENEKYTQSMGEEIANAVSHGIGTLLSIAGAAVIITYACFTSDAIGIVSASLYGASLILLYLFSTLYHSITNEKAKAVLRGFDHCSIFILILGSYIPISLSFLRGSLGWILFGVNAFLTVIGIVMNAISLEKWDKLSLVLYIIMGWSVVFTIKPIIQTVPAAGIWLLVGGGLAYSIGVIFYKLKKLKYMHSVWHLFVLAGSVLHFFFIMFYAIPIK